MKNTRILILATGFLAVAIVAFTIGASSPHTVLQSADVTTSNPEKSNEHTIIAGLTTNNRKEREKAAEDIRAQRADLIKQLLEFAGEKVEQHPDNPEPFYPWHDSKHLAILLLGDLRAVEAIPVLLENLEYENPRKLWSLVDIGGGHPAAEALSKIGMPAVGPTINKLGAYPPEARVNLVCRWILREILGARLARLRLQIAIEETRDEAVKRNLSAAAALPYFKTPEEKAAEERARQKKDSG